MSMRPMTPEQAALARQLTAPLVRSHGAPVHVGDPGAIGIVDLGRPDFGGAVDVREGEVPVFWACGVTPQEAIRLGACVVGAWRVCARVRAAIGSIRALLPAGIDFAITHAPGHMLVLDLPNE